MLGYQTAFLKAHYPAEYMAALLTSDMDNRDRLVMHIHDSRRLGIEVLPPDLNHSEMFFEAKGDDRIVFGLLAIKGIGEPTAREICRVRVAGGPFQSLPDLLRRVNLKQVSKASLEKFIAAGAADSLLPPGAHRAQLHAVVPTYFAATKSEAKAVAAGQQSLFDQLVSEETVAVADGELPKCAPWSAAEQLTHEKETLDLYVSGHPASGYAEAMRNCATHSIVDALQLGKGRDVILGGLITDVRQLHSKKAPAGRTKYLRFRLEDEFASIEAVCWPEATQVLDSKIVPGRVVFAAGMSDRTDDRSMLVVRDITDMDSGERRLAKGLFLRLHHQAGTELIEQLSELLTMAPGPCPVFMHFVDDAGKVIQLRLGQQLTVDTQKVPLERLQQLLGERNVAFWGGRKRDLNKPDMPAAVPE